MSRMIKSVKVLQIPLASKKHGDIDACSWDGFIPYPFSWSAFPYLYDGCGQIEQTQDKNKQSDAKIKGSVAMGREDVAIE